MTITVEQLEVLVKALAVLLGLVFTFVIKPFIDSKISQTEQAKLIEYIKIGVRCAEQIYTPEEWNKKKNYVLTEKELATLIEGFVFELKKENKNGVQ
mgnify:CR=1 FL=1